MPRRWYSLTVRGETREYRPHSRCPRKYSDSAAAVWSFVFLLIVVSFRIVLTYASDNKRMVADGMPPRLQRGGNYFQSVW